VNTCVIASNAVSYFWLYGGGGGASTAVLNNCLLFGNHANWSGGGAGNSTLNNCTVVNNSADYYGGGLDGYSASNCIVYYNSDNGVNCTFSYCCTTPNPGELGNITSEPQFANWTNADFHLQPASPCINAGNNSYVFGTVDADGRPRVISDTVDIGAYEFQNAFSVWLQQYGLPTDGSANYVDSDGDGLNNWQEWIAGTNPTNASSVLKMLSPSNDVSGITIMWQSVTNRNYSLDRSSDLGAEPSFSTIVSNVIGQAGTTSYTDTNAVGNGPYFYRIGVQ
jgi:hypothetical protein